MVVVITGICASADRGARQGIGEFAPLFQAAGSQVPTNAPPGVGLEGGSAGQAQGVVVTAGIARELRIWRVTMAKYARASSPPLNRFGMGEAGVNGALKENATVPVH